MPTILISDEAHKKLKILSAKCGKSMVDLLDEAVKLLLKKYGENNEE